MDQATVVTQLKICDLAKQWPALQAIHDLAMAELLKANVDAKIELTKRAEAKAANDAKLKAQADAKAADEAAAAAKAEAAAKANRAPDVPTVPISNNQQR